MCGGRGAGLKYILTVVCCGCPNTVEPVLVPNPNPVDCVVVAVPNGLLPPNRLGVLVWVPPNKLVPVDGVVPNPAVKHTKYLLTTSI